MGDGVDPEAGAGVEPGAGVDVEPGAGPGLTAGAGPGVAPGEGTTGAGGLPKSTRGGALTAPSSATVKFGFTFILNIIAVRLVGNCRTVVLNSCTDLM